MKTWATPLQVWLSCSCIQKTVMVQLAAAQEPGQREAVVCTFLLSI